MPSVAREVLPGAQGWVRGELQHLVEGLVLDPSIAWVNSIDATYFAERKLFQLRLARELGGCIPETLVTNQRDVVVDFVRAFASGVVCKPIYRGLWQNERERYAIYTRSVGAEDLPSAAELVQCPVLLQEKIARGIDVRVTCVGARLFSAAIEFNSSDAVDWRQPGQDISYQPVCLPEEVVKFCRAMMERLQLKFGAFDFIRSDSGKWYFLEVNPAGEWVWIERELGLPICDAIVDLLLRE